jgi:outer membrane immunogenic protein
MCGERGRIMKRFLLCIAVLPLATSAWAADYAAPAYKAPEYFSWTGWYWGVHGGFGSKTNSTTIVTQAGPPPFSFPIGHTQNTNHPFGALGGGQIGANYQAGQWVFGIEADASASGVAGSRLTVSPVNAAVVSQTTLSEDWMASVTGRIGYAFDRSLYYVKGGVAWAHFKSDSITSVILGANPRVTTTAEGDETRLGWTAGLGWEIAGPASYKNWSLRLETMYIDYGTERVSRTDTSGANTGAVVLRDAKTHETTTKLGINYRFGSYGPVYAKY